MAFMPIASCMYIIQMPVIICRYINTILHFIIPGLLYKYLYYNLVNKIIII